MADKYSLCIIGEMDRLWFQKTILFSEPTASSVSPEPLKNKPLPISESLFSPSSVISLPDEETSSDESPSPEKQASSESISVSLQDDSVNNQEEMKERLESLNLLGNTVRSHSSSPSSPSSTQNGHRKFRNRGAICTRKPLQKSMSCKTLGELELDEVQGFMDLGFTFNKENLNPRMMSVVPGLQRLGSMHQQNTQEIGGTETVRDNDYIEGKEENRDIIRPYLSEAWLIKRPDSPLLNLKIPKPYSAADMKKHLRFWAKIVASEIQ